MEYSILCTESTSEGFITATPNITSIYVSGKDTSRDSYQCKLIGDNYAYNFNVTTDIPIRVDGLKHNTEYQLNCSVHTQGMDQCKYYVTLIRTLSQSEQHILYARVLGLHD